MGAATGGPIAEKTSRSWHDAFSPMFHGAEDASPLWPQPPLPNQPREPLESDDPWHEWAALRQDEAFDEH